MRALNRRGFEAYVVGGCVRDGLMGAEPKDWDVTTDAAPEETADVFRGFKLLAHGLKYGTVTVIIGGAPVEVTTYRTDGAYSDGRRPDSVRFTRSLRDDISRRDFTINAIAYAPGCGLVDFYGGRLDIEKKIIRCVGDARVRFGEDTLRILRAMRFAARLSFEIEDGTAEAIHELRCGLAGVARERVSAELAGALIGGAEGVYGIINGFYDVIRVVIPELREGRNAQAALAVSSAPPELGVRLSLLLRGGGIEDETEACAILSRLRFGNEVIDCVKTLIKYGGYAVGPDAASIKMLMNKIGASRFKSLLLSRRASAAALLRCGGGTIESPGALDAIESTYNGILERGDCYTLKELNINGDDLKGLGFGAGKEIGSALWALLVLVIEGECPNERGALTRAAQTMI